MTKDENDSTPTLEQFKEDIRDIYSHGDLKEGYENLIFVTEELELKHNNQPVTYELILIKFRQHINWWNYMYKKKERSGMLRKEAEEARMDIARFITERGWEKEWDIKSGTMIREMYLFGTLPIKELVRQLRNFKGLWMKTEEKDKGKSPP